MSSVHLQTRDFKILMPLVMQYRITTAAAESARLGVSETTMRKRLAKLAAAGFVVRLTALMSQHPAISKPIFKWAPGDPEPDCGAIAWAAQRRWKDKPAKETTIYTASKKLLTYYGIRPRPHIKKLHATHDFGVMQVCEFCERHFPQYEFIGEDLFAPRGHGVAVEDAQLVKGEEVFAAIDFIGSYRKSRVEHLHRELGIERGLRYLLF